MIVKEEFLWAPGRRPRMQSWAFYVSGVKQNGGSNPVYRDPQGLVGMDVRDKAGGPNFQPYISDGSLLADASQRQYVTVVPNTPSVIEMGSVMVPRACASVRYRWCSPPSRRTDRRWIGFLANAHDQQVNCRCRDLLTR